LQVNIFQGWGGNGLPLFSHHAPGTIMAVTTILSPDSTESQPRATVFAAGFATHEKIGLQGGYVAAFSVSL
jgi:hypothetical protein